MRYHTILYGTVRYDTVRDASERARCKIRTISLLYHLMNKKPNAIITQIEKINLIICPNYYLLIGSVYFLLFYASDFNVIDVQIFDIATMQSCIIFAVFFLNFQYSTFGLRHGLGRPEPPTTV